MLTQSLCTNKEIVNTEDGLLTQAPDVSNKQLRFFIFFTLDLFCYVYLYILEFVYFVILYNIRSEAKGKSIKITFWAIKFI